MTNPDALRDLQRLGDQIAVLLAGIPVVDSGADVYVVAHASPRKQLAVSPALLREAARVLSASPYILH